MRLVLDVLFPPQCAGCEMLGSGFCFSCAASAAVKERRLPSLHVTAFARYEGAVGRAVRAVKDGRRDVAESLGVHLTPFVDAGSTLVPVSTTAVARHTRGFDGVELMARVAARGRAEVVTALRRSDGAAQRGRSRVDRLAALRRFTTTAAFAATPLVLFDDVCTTGTTLEDCAATLRAAGAVVEKAIVVALA